MRRIGSVMRIAGGGALLTLVLYGILALPGLITDRNSIVPVQPASQVRQ
ncbi:MAG: hypothetical protein ABI369_07290 [Acetobacteraceae bacterium]